MQLTAACEIKLNDGQSEVSRTVVCDLWLVTMPFNRLPGRPSRLVSCGTPTCISALELRVLTVVQQSHG